MTRVAAYVVLILLAFIFASTAPAWQTNVRLERDISSMLVERLANPDPRSPVSPVQLAIGDRIYSSACAACHGRINEGWSGLGPHGLGEPSENSPQDIHQIITWGHPTRLPVGLQYSGKEFEFEKDHPAFPASLTDTERWAVAIYMNSAGLHPEDDSIDRFWVDEWLGIVRPQHDPETLGPALFQRLCATCHGTMGHGNGPLANDLLPHPRDFHDTAWLANQSDMYLFYAITNGKDGLSDGEQSWTGMPAWGEYLDLLSLLRLTAYVRSFSYSIDTPPEDQTDEHEFIGPDASEWTWSEIRSRIPGAPDTPPEWMQR